MGVRKPELDRRARRYFQKGKRIRYAQIRPDICRRLRWRKTAHGGVRIGLARGDLKTRHGEFLRAPRRAHKGVRASIRKRARLGDIYVRPYVRL